MGTYRSPRRVFPLGRSVLPGVHDFVRLVPATPLAHGAAFSAKPLQSDEWVVELAFRTHGKFHSRS